jgi:hypothetical protein
VKEIEKMEKNLYGASKIKRGITIDLSKRKKVIKKRVFKDKMERAIRPKIKLKEYEKG